MFEYKIMVQIYKTVSDFVGDESPDVKVWVRATYEDLVELGLTHN